MVCLLYSSSSFLAHSVRVFCGLFAIFALSALHRLYLLCLYFRMPLSIASAVPQLGLFILTSSIVFLLCSFLFFVIFLLYISVSSMACPLCFSKSPIAQSICVLCGTFTVCVSSALLASFISIPLHIYTLVFSYWFIYLFLHCKFQ